MLCPSSETRAGQPRDIVYQSKALKVMNSVTLLVCMDLSCGTREGCLSIRINAEMRAPKKLYMRFSHQFFFSFWFATKI